MTKHADKTPRQVDQELSDLWSKKDRAQGILRSALEELSYASGLWNPYRVSRRERRTALHPAIKDYEGTKALALAKAEERGPYQLETVQGTIKTIETFRKESTLLQDEIQEREDEYQSRPWTRFFIVNGGHIHSSMGCSTCYPTTQFGWLPALSGKTEKDAVAEHGPLLCTICYPSAPVSWTEGIKKPEGCKGSGTYAEDYPKNRVYRYAKCPECGGNVSVTPSGKLRKHKAKEAKKN